MVTREDADCLMDAVDDVVETIKAGDPNSLEDLKDMTVFVEDTQNDPQWAATEIKTKKLNDLIITEAAKTSGDI